MGWIYICYSLSVAEKNPGVNKFQKEVKTPLKQGFRGVSPGEGEKWVHGFISFYTSQYYLVYTLLYIWY